MIYFISLVISLFAAGLEAFSYIGYVNNHFGIRGYWIYLASVILSLQSIVIPKIISKGLEIFAYVASFIYLILIFAETITYPNFVFSTTHINPFTFQFFVALLWFHTLIIKKTPFAKSLLLAGLIYVGVDGAGRTLGVAYKGMSDVVSRPFSSYAQKMTKVYPGFYPSMMEIARLTPTNSTILIPTQGNPWELEGNGAMVTYFLYPRTVRNMIAGESSKDWGDNTYILIAKGSWKRTGEVDYGWPKIKVMANSLWEFDTKNNQTIQYIRDYDPALDKWDWGLIEVKNE